MLDREIAIKIAPRPDGGLRLWSDDLPGLIMSGPDPAKIMADAWNAIVVLTEYRSE